MAEFKTFTENNVSWIEIELDNETVTAESGMMHYFQGDIEMTSKRPTVKGFFKSMFSGESIFRPTYKGTGKLVLEPSVGDFHIIELNGENMVLDKGAYVASDEGVSVDAKVNKLLAGFFSGEGIVQSMVKGKGKVAIACPGPIEIIELENEKLVVDGNFAVARSESLNFSVQKASRSLIGSFTSGEGLVTVLEGSGTVYLAPIPNKNVVLRQMIEGVLLSRMADLNPDERKDEDSGNVSAAAGGAIAGAAINSLTEDSEEEEEPEEEEPEEEEPEEEEPEEEEPEEEEPEEEEPEEEEPEEEEPEEEEPEEEEPEEEEPEEEEPEEEEPEEEEPEEEEPEE